MAAIVQNPKRLGRYDVRDEIGHGGMATVYRAHDLVLERDVALKVLHPHLRGAPEARARFAREARSVAKLRHPNVLDVYDFGEDDSAESYLAAELLTGPTLKEWITNKPRLVPEAAVALAILVGEALEAAHAAGIVHRDVKPENVLLHEDRTLKLTDFGIAHLVDAHSFTATGQVIGSPGHMAPEIVQGGDANVSTDVFAFGTVLYFLLTSTLPFTGRNPHQLLFRVLECEYTDPLRIEPAIGSELRSIVVRALAKDPAERPSSMLALVEELRAFLVARGFDDPHALAAAALADPSATSERIRPLALAAELRLGDQASQNRDSMLALAHYDRALALEPGRADVLERVRALGEDGEVPRRFRRIAVGLALAGVVALALAFVGSRMRKLDAPAAQSVTRTEPRPRVPAPSAQVPAAPGEVREPEPEVEATEAPARVESPGPRRIVASSEQPRLVVFRPEPQNVSISIDGAQPQAFGPSFRSASLTPGLHRIRITPGTDCCEALGFDLNLAAGTSPYVVSRSLPLRAARVYVITPVPAEVSISVGGAVVASGRARELVSIPMRELEGPAQIVVTAEGHRGYTGQVRLRAGEVARVTAALEPADP